MTHLEGLPRQFITSLKTLFDILDEEGCGFVKINDLENLWAIEKEDGNTSLPTGFLEALQKVCPPHGKLSFDKFMAGVKVALSSVKSLKATKQSTERGVDCDCERDETTTKLVNQRRVGPTATVPPNNALCNKRTLSMPQLRHMLPMEGERQTSLSSDSSGTPLEDAVDRTNDRRRHTLSNGVDYFTLCRLKLQEQERDMLLSAMDTVCSAKDWIDSRLSNLQKQYAALSLEPSPYSQESITGNEQERLRLLTATIDDLQMCLQQLTGGFVPESGPKTQGNVLVSDTGLIRPRPHSVALHSNEVDKEGIIQMLKAQNRMLTKEVSAGAERIAQLEKDKSYLICKMFQSSAKDNSVISKYDDTTFI